MSHISKVLKTGPDRPVEPVGLRTGTLTDSVWYVKPPICKPPKKRRIGRELDGWTGPGPGRADKATKSLTTNSTSRRRPPFAVVDGVFLDSLPLLLILASEPLHSHRARTTATTAVCSPLQ
ncbi:hypothetical protein PIB30_028352, partial [Stylosanthes scabra]|nr:hypothetical protein [Stylosanthes scabra]